MTTEDAIESAIFNRRTPYVAGRQAFRQIIEHTAAARVSLGLLAIA